MSVRSHAVLLVVVASPFASMVNVFWPSGAPPGPGMYWVIGLPAESASSAVDPPGQ
jgi:hypothetical protein